MLIDKNKGLINEFREHIETEEVREAYDILVNAARIHKDLSCHAQEKGAVRDFRFYCDESTQPFAFIINKNSLLFYMRVPAIRSRKYPLGSIQKKIEHVSENNREEVTLKIFNAHQARAVVTEILNKWWH